MAIQNTIYLHIGRHKTGTSSLQQWLADSHDWLQSRQLFYPKAGRKRGRKKFGVAHHVIANALNPKAPGGTAAEKARAIEDFRRDLLEELRDVRTDVLLSSEAFQNAPAAAVADLFSGIGPKVKIIVYLREQVEYLVSTYQQVVHAQRYTGTLGEFSRRRPVDYEEFLEPWVQSFGRENVRVRVYARNALKSGSIVDDFLDAIGISVSAGEIDRVADHNPSVGGAALELKRMLNTLPADASLPPRTYAVFKQLASQDARFRIKPPLSEQFVSEFRAAARPSNSRVASEYFDRDTLFEAPSTAKPAPSIAEEELVKALIELTTLDPPLGMRVVEAAIIGALGAVPEDLRARRNRVVRSFMEGDGGPLRGALRAFAVGARDGEWRWNYDQWSFADGDP